MRTSALVSFVFIATSAYAYPLQGRQATPETATSAPVATPTYIAPDVAPSASPTGNSQIDPQLMSAALSLGSFGDIASLLGDAFGDIEGLFGSGSTSPSPTQAASSRRRQVTSDPTSEAISLSGLSGIGSIVNDGLNILSGIENLFDPSSSSSSSSSSSRRREVKARQPIVIPPGSTFSPPDFNDIDDGGLLHVELL